MKVNNKMLLTLGKLQKTSRESLLTKSLKLSKLECNVSWGKFNLELYIPLNINIYSIWKLLLGFKSQN